MYNVSFTYIIYMKITEYIVPVQGHQFAVQATNEDINTPAIIFIHGVLASYKFWNEVLPIEIREQRRWYSVSLPGHFPSKIPEQDHSEPIDEQWFIDYIDKIVKYLVPNESYILVGHSTGGFAALNYATSQPRNLLGVVSIAGFYQGNWGGIEGALVKLAGLGSWTKPFFTLNLALGRLTLPIQKWLSAKLAYDKKSYYASKLTDKMLKCIQPLMKQQKLSNLFPLFNRINTLNILPQLKDISVRTFIIAGNKDPVISAEQSLILASNIADAKVIAFDQVGHMPFMEREKEFSLELIKAIQQIDKMQDEK